MPTDASSHRRTQAREFAVRGVAWSLGLFGGLRLAWFETHAVLPLTHVQARIAQGAFGAPALPIDVTLACSGADALALCSGAILAYPVSWRVRLTGAAGGIALILGINIVRIGTLGRVAASPPWFHALHLYVWPGVLMLAIAGYVFGWMRRADRRVLTIPAAASAAAAGHFTSPASPVTRRFVLLTAAFVVLFTAASPLYLENAGVLALAAFITRAGAAALGLLGVESSATGNVLSTSRGAFLVTQECISTPLIPVYLAAMLAYARTWQWRMLALAAAGPLFVGLGIARLLVVAIPGAVIGSPLFLIHAFYQLLLAAVLVCLAALWRHGPSAAAWQRALVGGVAGAVLMYVLGPACARALNLLFAAGPPLDDPQGAIGLLPSFQIGLFVALSVAVFVAANWQSVAAGLGVLGLSQVAGFAALHFVIRHAGPTPHVRDVRAWALAGPLLIVAALVAHDRTRR